MDKELSQQLLHALFKFKKINVKPQGNPDLNLREFAVLIKLAKKDFQNSLFDDNLLTSDLRNILNVTKPAISHIMNSLERKTYIKREIDPFDRRRFLITITTKGHEAMQLMHDQSEKMFSAIIDRFGEENTIQFISLFERFCEIAETVAKESQFSP